MVKRGRKSAAELSIVRSADGLADSPLSPMPGLPAAEKQVWAATVNALPASWFSAEHVPLLAQYCRHVVAAQRIAGMIEEASADSETALEDYDVLLRMQDRESKAVANLARSMRMTHQAQMRTETAGRKHRNAPKSKPWED